MLYDDEDRTTGRPPTPNPADSSATRAADRRSMRRMAAVGAAIVAATALGTAGVAQTAGATPGGAEPSGTLVFEVPAPDPTAPPKPASPEGAAPEPSAAPAPDRPTLRITLAYERTGRDLALTLGFGGHVYRPYSTESGKPVQLSNPAGREIGLGEKLVWGDGTQTSVPSAPQRCPKGAEKKALHQVEDTYTVQKTYKAAGEYTINYTYFACGLTDGKINGSLTLQIP